MAVIEVRARNFKKLENIDIKPNGKSFFVIGDTNQGKTTLMKIILSTLMIEDFPEDPITTGKTEGYIEAVHELDGIKYTVRRTFTDKKDSKTRFTVTDQNGGRHTLSTLLEKIFGKAFTNSYFDYNEYFHKQKSSDTRYAYFVKAIGGDRVFENNIKKEKLLDERGRLGTERTKYRNIVDHSSLNPETLEADLLYYKDEKLQDEAILKKNEILAKRKSIVNLTNQLTVVKEGNSAYEISEESLTDINAEIDELEKKLLDAKESRDKILTWQKNNQPDFETQNTLTLEIANADEFNKTIEQEADELYDDLIRTMNVHNNMRNELNTAITSYNEYIRYDTEWNEKDGEIKALIEENKKIFADRIQIEGMSIEEINGKPVIMYDGREFSWENLSKGKSLRLTMEIQRMLNPKGNNLIVIPEAQSLGSELDEILEECKEHGIQAIVEVTERKQEFKIKFEEDFLK